LESASTNTFSSFVCGALRTGWRSVNHERIIDIALASGYESHEGLPAQTLKYLYATWLPASGEELRDFPLYLQRVRFFPDVPEHEAIVDVFLPLR
jgi:DNA gyrase inhibitor GyrI